MADHAHTLPPDDRDVARGIVLEAAESGMTRAGQVLDALEGMTPDARRRLRDRAHERVGTPAAPARDVSVPRISDTPARDAAGRAIQLCPADSCRAFPVDQVTGSTLPVVERRWWCQRHRHLAAPGDLEPWRSRLAYGPSGSIIDLDEIERDAEIAAIQAKRRSDELEQRRAQRLAQWPAVEAESAAKARLLVGANLKGANP